MPKHNPANERIKRDYFAYLKGPRGRDAATIDAVAKSLARFEASTGARDFKNSGANRPPALASGWLRRAMGARASG